MVALLTAPVNLLVDFLFVEIISAPTMDSLKKEQSSLMENSVRKVIGRASTVVRKMSVVSQSMMKHIQKKTDSESTLRLEVSDKPDSWKNLISTTRVIPPRTKEAHAEAAECVNDVVSSAKSRMETRNTLMKSRYDSYVGSHHKIGRQRRTEVEVIPTSTLLRTHQRERNKSISNVKVDVDGLFERLTFHVNQQRKLLKRSQQDGFDQMWG